MELWNAKMAMKKPATNPPGADPSTGRFAYDGLERIFHEKARLGILTSLVSHPKGLVFADLKDLCALTDGNLSRHLQALHEAGLVEVWKGYHQNRPQTLCRLTDAGRTRFLEYITVLENVVGDALAASKAAIPPLAAPTDGLSPA
jgi:DNA-binding MarR family transcriptional regulator